ncbi:hypothetical protein B5E58_10785 [Tyzzerella sp. An114]|uniref:DUF2577 domain-containing protein n=1 Tax=Tyzzerella sp. An114 TaxID=1965545 RepID=UPI000B447E60|nr:DUF2577 domain-containing protein [Tyzzerella sp. An114]OUQ56325.1 hypothetical protein B5E58_10785 [Tyzzerella sp. An114]
MLNSSDFVKVIKKSAIEAVKNSKPTDIFYGTVQSISPLTIFIDQKLILSEKFLIIPESLTDYETEISFDDSSIKQVFTTWDMEETSESSPSKISFKEKIKHKITVYNGLKAGEAVILLRQQGGQKYMVLDRAVTL